MRHRFGASQHLKMQMLVGMAFGFLLVVMIGVASADETPTSDPVMPDVELAPAVVVAAGADSLDVGAVGALTAESGGLVQRGTAFQLDDGRLATVAHALVDARSARVDGSNLPLDAGAITRLHDLAAIATSALPSELSVSPAPGEVGQVVALAGIPPSGRIEVLTGEIIARSSGSDYGIGRPDVYVISARVERGWSGGPVVDASGRVIAVIVGVEQRSGVTLAVPIEYLPAPE